MPPRWTLNVPFVQAETAPAVSASFKAEISGINLLAEDSPTMMEEWAITSLHVPFAFCLNTIVPPLSPPFEVNARVTLKVGGDIVSQIAVETITAIERAAANAIGISAIANSDLNNPVILPHGRTLTMDFSLSVAIGAAKQSILLIGVSESYINTAVAEPFLRTGPQGIVSYDVIKLSGHREL